MRISSLICIFLITVSTIQVSWCKNHRLITGGNYRSTTATPIKGDKDRGVRFGTISRDEWLAKEYFGYLCGE